MVCFCLETEENGAKADPILGETHYLNEADQEISSLDYKVSPSNAVTGMRDRPPMSYSLKMESFNTLLQSNETERYESRPFTVGGYNWYVGILILFPSKFKNPLWTSVIQNLWQYLTDEAALKDSPVRT